MRAQLSLLLSSTALLAASLVQAQTCQHACRYQDEQNDWFKKHWDTTLARLPHFKQVLLQEKGRDFCLVFAPDFKRSALLSFRPLDEDQVTEAKSSSPQLRIHYVAGGASSKPLKIEVPLLEDISFPEDISCTALLEDGLILGSQSIEFGPGTFARFSKGGLVGTLHLESGMWDPEGKLPAVLSEMPLNATQQELEQGWLVRKRQQFRGPLVENPDLGGVTTPHLQTDDLGLLKIYFVDLKRMKKITLADRRVPNPYSAVARKACLELFKREGFGAADKSACKPLLVYDFDSSDSYPMRIREGVVSLDLGREQLSWKVSELLTRP